jgi:hypothetical protein
MFALLQIYRLEAHGPDDPYPLDVLVVNPSETALENYLADYRPRYEAAVAEFNAWDKAISTNEWTEQHNIMLDECADKHGVFGSLIEETRFKIVEVLTDVGPARTARQRPRTQDQAA